MFKEDELARRVRARLHSALAIPLTWSSMKLRLDENGRKSSQRVDKSRRERLDEAVGWAHGAWKVDVLSAARRSIDENERKSFPIDERVEKQEENPHRCWARD